MSCDHHRRAYFRRLGQGGGAICDTFGTSREIETALEKIYNTACSQAARGDPRQVRQAEAATQALFDQMAASGIDMRHLHHTALPAHKDTWFGYAAIYHTLEAVRNRRPLPALASAILAHQQRTRRLSALGKDAHGYHRCASCGRFTSPVREHLCPITASPETLNRALMRRLGVPATAYGIALGDLLDDARNRGGTIAMHHSLTGEKAEVTLDGLPLALATGFAPDTWKGQATAVELADGRIVSVLDANSLTPLHPPAGAVAEAGSAYGISIPEGAQVVSAAGLPHIYHHPDVENVTPTVQENQAQDRGYSATVAQPVLVNVNAPVDTRPIAEALKSIPQPQIAAPNAANTSEVTELRHAMSQMAKAVETLAKAQGKAPAVSGSPSAAEQRLLDAAERLSVSLSPASISSEPATHRSGRCPRCGLPLESGHICPPSPPRKTRLPADMACLTKQEQIFRPVILPAPDPFLSKVSAHIGGQLYQPLTEHIPELDPHFELNKQAEKILHMMSTGLQIGAGKQKSNWSRAFGLYGPPGTGKNTLARQLAASVRTIDSEGHVSQGMNYTEANITPESSMAELIGTTVLETDPTSGATISRARLGKIGLAAAMGSVICINEIVRSPKLATALQSMIEDGEIQIDSPEQGLIRIPVHPSTVFICTWNPGYEGDAERPAAAPLSRMIPMRLDYPSLEEQAHRVNAFLGAINGDTVDLSEQERFSREAISKDYAVPARIEASREEILAATRFFNEVQRLAGGGVGEKMIGLNSATSTAPGPRELGRFVALGKTIGWEDALETLKITCDQDDQFESQWQLVRERFEAHFGSDAEALKRQQEGGAPAVS